MQHLWFWRTTRAQYWVILANWTSIIKSLHAYISGTAMWTENGRFIISLPFSDSVRKLGTSRDIALSSNEYLNLGHIKEINPNHMPHPHYFLAHHCVLRPESSSLKLRVMFDASTKTSANISLKDILHVGPTVKDEFFAISAAKIRIQRKQWINGTRSLKSIWENL